METAVAPLPSRVAAPPARPTVLYDGRCRLCTASAERIRKLDRAGAIDVVDLHLGDARARFPEIELAAVLEAMHLVEPTGEIARGADAVRHVLRRLPGLRWLGLLWMIPGFPTLAHVGYGVVARNRYWFNRHQTCGSPGAPRRRRSDPRARARAPCREAGGRRRSRARG